MKIKLQLLTILAIFVLVFPAMILAESLPPVPPLLVWGNVSIDDQLAPLDTEILAEIDDVEVAVAIMIREGIYYVGIPDGEANEGKMIIFKVNGIANNLQLECANIDTTPSINFDLAIITITTRPCSISNGIGIQTWDGSSWEDCIIESCDSGYHKEGNSCIADSTTPSPPPPSGGGTPPSPPSYETGDTNKDNKVDKYDFALMMADWGKTGVNSSDLNGDNKVDKYDFALLMLNWS